MGYSNCGSSASRKDAADTYLDLLPVPLHVPTRKKHNSHPITREEDSNRNRREIIG